MASSAAEVPDYDDLPIGPDGFRTAWGVFGPKDSVGTVNLQTPERIRAAAQLVRRGALFPLDVAVGSVDPPFFSRGAPRHTLIERFPGNGFDDVVDSYFPQAGSQWDSLAHVAAAPGRFYNDVAPSDVRVDRRNTIDHWARRGIAGRGVLLDVGDVVAQRGGPSASIAVTVEDLEAARRHAGIEWAVGDILLVRTGYLAWYTQQDAPGRQEAAREGAIVAAGLDHSEEMARYLWNSHFSAVASDTVGLEVWPPDRRQPGFGRMHPVMIGRFGLAIGELWALDALARDCAEDGVWEFFITSAPMNLPGGVGSAPNAIAVK